MLHWAHSFSDNGAINHNFNSSTFSSESACLYSDTAPFSSIRPSRLKKKSTPSLYSLVLVFFNFQPRGSIQLGVKNNYYYNYVQMV